MADYSLVRYAGEVRGFWLRDPTAAQNPYLLAALAFREGVQDKIGSAIDAGNYRVVPNRYDSQGGCFVMMESWPAPGEPGWK
ncbi:MAG: hypothetical protein ACLQPD_18990 [Desulfomonilaceae bacterium]